MSLRIEEMGTMEIGLRWEVINRIFWMVFTPLFLTLLFDNIVINVILWLITIWIFFSLVNSWGHSVISIMVGLIPLYIYFAWETAPDWLAYIAGLLIAFQFAFIKNRIKEVEGLRNREDDMSGIF